MISKDFKITNELGLHARPSAQLTQIAGRYESEVFIAKNGRRVNAKSIMGVLMLVASCGSKIRIICRGDQAEAAVGALAKLVYDRFGEE